MSTITSPTTKAKVMYVPISCPYCETVAFATGNPALLVKCGGCGSRFYASTARCRSRQSRHVSDQLVVWRIEAVAADDQDHLFQFEGDKRVHLESGHLFSVTYRIDRRKRREPWALRNHAINQSWRLGYL